MRVCNYNFAKEGKLYIMNNVINSSPSLASPSSTSSSIAANGSTAGRTGAGTGRTTLVVATMHDGSASAATVFARPALTCRLVVVQPLLVRVARRRYLQRHPNRKGYPKVGFHEEVT